MPKLSVWSIGDVTDRYKTRLFETGELILFLGSREPKPAEYEVIKRCLGVYQLEGGEEFIVITALCTEKVINFILRANASSLELFEI